MDGTIFLSPRKFFWARVGDEEGAHTSRRVFRSVTQRFRVSVKLVNKWGLHAKTSFRLATAAMGYKADIVVEKDGAIADAKRMDELLLLIAEAGDTLHITATGPDSSEAAENIAGIIRSGFGEG